MVDQNSQASGESSGFSSMTDCSHISENTRTNRPRPSHLYGRSSERLMLLKAYQTVLQTTRPKTVLVHGEAGAGKTSLVEYGLGETVRASDGYFCSGKFFQNDGVREPYSAIMASFSDLGEQLLREEGSDAARMEFLRNALAADGHLLSRSVTGVAPLLASPQRGAFDPRHGNQGGPSSFARACKAFLHSIASGRRPVVLFLDDAQWMDDGSRKLLEAILSDQHKHSSNLMIVLVYRDEEPKMPRQLIATCNNRDDILDIQLKRLPPGAVQQMLTSLLGTTSAEIRALSELVTVKTGGNPFYVQVFMNELLDRELLLFCSSSRLWFFDLDTIHRETAVSETVADLLSQQLQRLPRQMQAILKVAAMLGIKFTSSALQDVMHIFVKSRSGSQTEDITGLVENSLKEAVEAGYVEQIKSHLKDEYKFSHDKIQLACQEIVGVEERNRLHFLVGDFFLLNADTDENCAQQAALHLNQVPLMLLSNDKRVRLAQVNLRAAMSCSSKSAFHDAKGLLHKGLRLLEADKMWSHHFELAFQLTESLAKVSLIVGAFDDCASMTREALSRASSVEMKANLLVLQVEAQMTQNKLVETIASCDRALRVLGVKMPRKVQTHHVMYKLAKVKGIMLRKTDENILALPLLQNAVLLAAVKLLVHQCLSCLFRDEQDQGVYAALLATELTLGSGLSCISASAFAVLGIAEVSMGNHGRGYRFGKLSLRILDHVQCLESECQTMCMATASLLHWRESLQDRKELFHQAMHKGLECGNRIFGMFGVANCFAVAINLGENLGSLKRTMRSTYRQSCETSLDAMSLWAQPAMQFVLNLQSYITDWGELTSLTGEIMKEEVYLQQVNEAGHVVLKNTMWMYKSMLCYYMGDYATAASILESMEKIGILYHGTCGVITLHFFGAMASLALLRETGDRKHARVASRHQKALLGVASAGNPNATPYLVLLDAEKASSLRKATVGSKLVSLYSQAITMMESEGLVHMKALAHERLAHALLDIRSSMAEAEHHFHRAMDSYQRWGATAKRALLKQQVDSLQLLEEEKRRESATSIVGSVIEIDYRNR